MKLLCAFLMGFLTLQTTFGYIIQAVDDGNVDESFGSQSTPIPLASPGFSIGATKPTPSRVDVFVDPHCPFSKGLLENLQFALDKFWNVVRLGDQIEVYIHYVNLPFHPFSHSAIVALNYLEAKHPKAVLRFLGLMFANLVKFNKELWDQKQSAVRQLLSQFVQQAIGSGEVPSDVFTDTYLQAARLTFKYAMNREVYGSPVVHINWVKLDDVPSTGTALFDLLKQFLR